MNRICYMKMAFSLSSHSSSSSRIQWMTNLRIRRLFGNSWRLWSELRRLCRLYLHSEQQRRETNLSRFFNLCDFDWCCFRRKTLSYDWKSCNPFEARRRREESDLTYLSSSISLITMSVRAEEFVTTQYRWLLGWREERKTSQDSRKSLQQQADISEQSYTVGGLCEIVLHPLLSSLQEREEQVVASIEHNTQHNIGENIKLFNEEERERASKQATTERRHNKIKNVFSIRYESDVGSLLWKFAVFCLMMMRRSPRY